MTKITKKMKQHWMQERFIEADDRGLTLDLKKLIAAFIIENYSTKRYAMELINSYETLGLIEITKGVVTITR